MPLRLYLSQVQGLFGTIPKDVCKRYKHSYPSLFKGNKLVFAGDEEWDISAEGKRQVEEKDRPVGHKLARFVKRCCVYSVAKRPTAEMARVLWSEVF